MKLAVFQNMKFGGAMRASYEIGRQLAERGHELHLFRYRFNHRIRDLYHVPKETENPLDFSRYATIHEMPDPRPIHRFVPRGRLRNIVANFHRISDLQALDREAAGAAARIDALDCDAVLLHLCAFTNAPLLLSHLKTPSYWYCQEPSRNLFDTLDDVLDRGKSRSARLYRRRRRSLEVSIARGAGTILCNSAFSRESIMRAYGIEAVVCRLGVDVDLFRPGDCTKKNQVICWGPLWPAKGLDFIVRSIGRIPSENRPKVVFPWTRGSEGYRKELEAMARTLGVVLETPRGLEDDKLLRCIHASLACIYAPHMEPLGLVAIEAMAAGLPVVGVREGGVRETVLDGVTGFLCERDEEEVSERVRDILSDEPLRERLASQAVDYVREHWRWASTIDRLEKLLS